MANRDRPGILTGWTPRVPKSALQLAPSLAACHVPPRARASGIHPPFRAPLPLKMPVVRRARRFAGLALADFLASRPTGQASAASDGTEACLEATATCPPSSCSPAAAHAVVITVAVNADASLVLLCLLFLIAPGLVWFAVCGPRSAICVGLFCLHSQAHPSQTSPSFLPFGTPLSTSPPPTATVRLPRHAVPPSSFHSPPPPPLSSSLAALIPVAHHGFVCLTASARVPWFVCGLLTTCFSASRIGSVFRSFWHTMTSDDRREHAVRKPATSAAVC